MKNLRTIEQCCSPLLQEPIEPAEAVQLATAFKVLGDPARLRILSLIAAGSAGEMCVCEMVGPLGLSQPTVSHHLKVLHEAGLLRREKRGTWAFYAVVPERVEALRDALSVTAAVPA
ncbi:MAG TPA: metalloregulator ArsR/SmtB family transcription factor [Actinomycetota bacterium]|nr:metalloregulator ArsR/SmtB family transcription factor [Actinomycetota bacterium]